MPSDGDGSRDLTARGLSEWYETLASGPEGLPTEEALRRRRRDPSSEVVQPTWLRDLRLLFRQFSSPLILLLLVAVMLSGLLGEISDTLIILGILLLTGLVGFFQERHADRAMEALKRRITLRHVVKRNGREEAVNAEELVPGDVLVLRAGDIIPADCRIISAQELHVNESALTGESVPAEKFPGEVNPDGPLTGKSNCLWRGTHVASGTAVALVIRTGRDTIFGGIAQSIQRNEESTFEIGSRRFGYFLLRITLILTVFILVAHIYFGRPLFESVLFALALAVGMAPELLPAIMTFAMSAGARRLMTKKVVVKKLSSVFNLGEVRILCTDKTGTITEGAVRMKAVVDIHGEPDRQNAFLAFLNASLQGGYRNSMDDLLAEGPYSTRDYALFDELPYDFIRKRLSVAVAHEGSRMLITKGAFRQVLDICSQVRVNDMDLVPLTPEMARQLEDRYRSYGAQGLRVLALAMRDLHTDRLDREDEKDLTFLGFILFEDPVKEGAMESLHRLQSQGVGVKILTGDNRYAAAYLAGRIGLNPDHMITGDTLRTLTPEALRVRVGHTSIFCELEPHHKERIVQALRHSGKAVAYLGDGINDVSAIHAADAGISTDNAVDVAKEAADFVLLEKDLSVLADGIHEGRISFRNSMKYLFITTGATFGNMLTVAVASLVLPFLPMLPKQILLTNLISDLPFLAIAYDQVDATELKKPGRWNLGLVQRFMLVFGCHSAIFDLITFALLYKVLQLSGAAFQTGWFMESVVSEILILFVIRTQKPFYRSRPGVWLLRLAVLAILVTFLLPFTPFARSFGFAIEKSMHVFYIIGILLLYLVTAEWLKGWFFRHLARGVRA